MESFKSMWKGQYSAGLTSIQDDRTEVFKAAVSIKDKNHLRTGHEGPKGEWRYSSALSLISALHRGGWSTPRPGRFAPGKNPVPIVWEAGWASEPVWTGAEYLALTGIRSTDGPVRGESLYRLRYPGPRRSQYKPY